MNEIFPNIIADKINHYLYIYYLEEWKDNIDKVNKRILSFHTNKQKKYKKNGRIIKPHSVLRTRSKYRIIK